LAHQRPLLRGRIRKMRSARFECPAQA
jgi:hypothetical protein